MQPPRLTVIAHGKLSSYVVPIQPASGRSLPAATPYRSTRSTRSTYPLGRAASNSGRMTDACSPPSETRRPRFQKFRHSTTVAHIAIGFRPTIAWKASPTRTPPPICTSAPFLKPRWSQDRGRRERLKECHDARFLAIRLVTGAVRVFATVALLQLPISKASF